MERSEILKTFEKHLNWTKRNVPPDDIYLFSEQLFLAAYFFLKQWSKEVDLEKECSECEVADMWVRNILCICEAKQANKDMTLNLVWNDIDN